VTGKAEPVRKSAERLADSADQQTEAADRRTVLAGDRTLLAAERTYAAWVRTALAALASGVGAPALLTGVVPDWVARGAGTVLILFAGFCVVAAVWRDLRDGLPPPRPDLRPIPAWLLVAVNVFLLAVVAAALVGVWAGDFRRGG
jgi:putative membrane protein